MASLAKMVAEEARGSLPRENFGISPLDLTDMQGIDIPLEYDITSVLGDILMCEVADENVKGEVKRNGIIISESLATKMWRVAKVLLCGPLCSDNVKTGDFVMYPSDKGIPLISHDGKKLIFLNESRMFCICKPRDIIKELPEENEIAVPVNTTDSSSTDITTGRIVSVCCAGCGKLFNQKDTIKSNGLSWCGSCGSGKKIDSKLGVVIKVK